MGLDELFHPRSIAVVGVSEEETKPGTRYLDGLLTAGYKGEIYLVNREGGEVRGFKVYRSVKEIPHPVDLVSVFIPREGVLELVKDCCEKGVKGIQFFTAGFSELDDYGRRLEKEMVKIAKEHGVRIIGPNCIGLSCTRCRMSLGPGGFFGEEGNVGFISQSGGFAGLMYNYGNLWGLKFSKVASYGNASDVDDIELLSYLFDDPDTHYIGAYFEGTRRGRELFELIKRRVKEKPFVIWKGGRTEEGGETALSHTGSMKSSFEVWRALVRQTGAVESQGIEETVSVLLAFQNLPPIRGNRVLIIAGVIGPGGGMSVISTDILPSYGLDISPISDGERRKLEGVLTRLVGTIRRNPLDLGGVPIKLGDVLEIFSGSDYDIILIWIPLWYFQEFRGWGEDWERASEVIIDFKRSMKKPLALISPPGFPGDRGRAILKKLFDNGVCVFPSVELCGKALSSVISYWRRNEG